MAKPSAAAIVPAYNEASTIGGVIRVLAHSQLFDEVIVVDDGSEDKTAQLARRMGARVVSLNKNQGKGWALYAGVKKTNAPILFFIDADLEGLKLSHLRQIIEPVVQGAVDMNIGFIARGNHFSKLYRRLNAPLSGQRALKREIWEKIDFKKLPRRWEPESALNFVAKEGGYKISSVELSDIKHRAKEVKWGLWQGLFWRLRMIGRIALILIWLRIKL